MIKDSVNSLCFFSGGERKSWYRYTDNIGSRNPWVNKLFSEFRDEAVKLRKACELSQMPSSSSAPSLLVPQTSPSASSGSGRKTLSPGTSQSVNTSPGMYLGEWKYL